MYNNTHGFCKSDDDDFIERHGEKIAVSRFEITWRTRLKPRLNQKIRKNLKMK